MVSQLESFIRTKDEFRDLMKIFHFASDMCEDLHVVDRKVLQRVDDNTAIIKCDLSNLLQFRRELVLYDLAKIVKNLKGLNKDGPIRFKIIGETMSVRDTSTSISVTLRDEKYCNNKNITEAEFDEIFLLGPMFLECEIDKKLCDLVSRHAKLSNQHTVMLNIREGNVLLGYGSNKDQAISSEFKVNCKLKMDIYDCELNLPASIFGLKIDATLKIYFDEKNGKDQAIAVCIFNIFINPNTVFEIYCRSYIKPGQGEK